MAIRKRKTTLYFTDGSNLSDADIAAMDSIPGGAFHRNARMIDPEGKLEPCDYVAGPAIPEQYAEKYEVVECGDGGLEQVNGEDLTVADLRTALTNADVAFEQGARKGELVELYNAHFNAE